MPSNDYLEAAGRRAALGPVPTPPTIDELTAEVGRRRNKRRKVIGGAMAALVAVIALPIGVALVSDDQPDAVTLATDDGEEISSEEPAGLASQVEPSTTSTTAAPSSSTETTVTDAPLDPPEGRGPFAGLNDENFDLQLNLGDESFAIAVISGDDAAARAADAQAAADETRQIDDQTVWIKNDGDEVTASALFDDETFVEVRGPKEQIERILDLVSEHADGPVMFFDPSEFAERFGLPEGLFDSDGFPGEDFSFEDFPFEEGESPFFPFFEDGTFRDFENEMKDFAECMNVTVDRSGTTTKIEIPDCDLPNFDSFLDEGPFKDFPLDLENLDLENLDLDDLFDGLMQHPEDATIN